MGNELDLPIAMSASADNCYHLNGCNETGNRPNYAVCLHKIKLRKSGPLIVQLTDCSAGIGQKRCPALQMMKQEVEAGKALFFISRSALRVEMEANVEIAQGKMEVSKDKHAKKVAKRATSDYQPIPTPVLQTTVKVEEKGVVVDSGGYSEAINRAISKAVAKSETTVAKVATPMVSVAKPHKPAGGLLAYAQQMLGATL